MFLHRSTKQENRDANSVVPCSIVLIAVGLYISKSLINIIFWGTSSSSCEQSISIIMSLEGKQERHCRNRVKSLKSPQPKFRSWFRCKFLSMVPVFHLARSTCPATKTFVAG